jgi:uncharacterized protein DUF6166
MKRYQGRREGYVVDVTVEGHRLNPRLDLWNHSPTGFEWGYGGSGPAQLALALLADHLGDDVEAVRLHQEFKRAVVANLSHRSWILTSLELKQAVEKLRARSEASQPAGTEMGEHYGQTPNRLEKM